MIATDPIGERRPAAKAYIEEIQKVTRAPIKYAIYSHSYFDHIAGGQPFKDLGAVFVAHANAKARIEASKTPAVVVPDEMADGKREITLGSNSGPGPFRSDRRARDAGAIMTRGRVAIVATDSSRCPPVLHY